MRAKLLRGARRARRGLGSTSRVALLKAMFPGLRVEGRVSIGPGCDVYVAPGSTLVLRDCAVAAGVTLATAPGATLDIDADFIGVGSVVVARVLVRIGRGSKVAEYVTIRDADHDHSVPLNSLAFRSRPGLQRERRVAGREVRRPVGRRDRRQRDYRRGGGRHEGRSGGSNGGRSACAAGWRWTWGSSRIARKTNAMPRPI